MRVGEVVPGFEIDVYDPAAGDFGRFALAEQRARKRWTILMFYPADFTFVCPTELADLAAYHEELRASGADVVSVSTDTKYVHLAWVREERLLAAVRFPMGSDPTGRLCRLFDVYDDEQGTALRGTFIISPEGRLMSSEVHSDRVGRSAAELVRTLKAHLHVAAHPDEACPARWQEGQRTLTPGGGPRGTGGRGGTVGPRRAQASPAGLGPIADCSSGRARGVDIATRSAERQPWQRSQDVPRRGRSARRRAAGSRRGEPRRRGRQRRDGVRAARRLLRGPDAREETSLGEEHFQCRSTPFPI